MSLSVECRPSSPPGVVLAERVIQRPRPKAISLKEYIERTGSVPSIPLASVLHAEYVEQRNLEKEKGTYVPGELLPVDFDQPSLRQLFIDRGRKNIYHDRVNADGKIVTGTPIDWYNPTQPFNDKGDRIMAVRFEPRDSELSLVGFIKEDQRTGKYRFDYTRPIIDMAQDPSVTFDNKGNLILGVVKIHVNNDGKITHFKTVQFIGHDVRNLRVFQTLQGKDNRPVQLDDRVRGFYRPQGEVGGSGKLAVRNYPDWEEYRKDARALTEADLLTTNFQDGNHGGPNFPLPDGQVYGHIAEIGRDKKGDIVKLDYYDTWKLTDLETGQFIYKEDPKTGILTPVIKVVGDRLDYPAEIPDKDPANPQKRRNVSFTGGVVHLPDGKVMRINGACDTRIGTRIFNNPMLDIDWSSLRVLV